MTKVIGKELDITKLSILAKFVCKLKFTRENNIDKIIRPPHNKIQETLPS